MTEEECLSHMVFPSQRRPNAYMGGIIQIHITRACDRACFNCTQGSQLGGPTSFITIDNFISACKSLQSYFGVVGIFGGNPVLHPQFPLLCEILRKYIPYERRGIWCNHPHKHAAIMRATFNPIHSNLNVHQDQEAFVAFKVGWPECKPVGLDKDSRHSPPYVAMKDIIRKECPNCLGRKRHSCPDCSGRGCHLNGGGIIPPGMHCFRCSGSGIVSCSICSGSGFVMDNDRIYSLIASCDINKNWSAMIAQFRGQLRGYFCEIAGAQAVLHQYDEAYPDTGISIPCMTCAGTGTTTELNPPLLPETKTCPTCQGKQWWQQTDFTYQVRHHCFSCGIPLRGHGELANASSGKEQVSATHLSVYKLKRPTRELEVVSSSGQLGKPHTVTEYIQAASL